MDEARWLELKVPPPVVTLIMATGMWAIAGVGPGLAAGPLLRSVLAAAIAGAGFAVMGAGVLSFRRARTTISPLNPESSTALVTSGIYARTRNPMYLGMCLILVAWAIYLQSLVAFIGPAAFVAYIRRFQIQPEERVLLSLFGQAYESYKGRVRQWV